jgi:hypothetical protein
MKFIIAISHVVPHNLNHVYKPFEEFDHFHITNYYCLIYLGFALLHTTSDND